MNIKDLLEQLSTTPRIVEFADVMACIDANYLFTPSAFRNGELSNAEGENNGSCKIFAFAKLHSLDKQQTLNCFGDYYRQDVLQDPDGDSHQNIRNFIQSGWPGISFESDPLKAK